MTPPFRLIKFRPPPTEPPRSTPYLNATSETFLKKVGSLSQRSLIRSWSWNGSSTTSSVRIERRRVMDTHNDGRPLARTLRFPRRLTWMQTWPATLTPARHVAVRLAVTGLRLAR
jgi:hypothetical protein